MLHALELNPSREPPELNPLTTWPTLIPSENHADLRIQFNRVAIARIRPANSPIELNCVHVIDLTLWKQDSSDDSQGHGSFQVETRRYTAFEPLPTNSMLSIGYMAYHTNSMALIPYRESTAYQA